mgnify:CR=1 FL=1
MAETSVTYVGMFDAVIVPLDNGAEVIVQRNETVSLPEDLAAGLLRQVDNWKPGKAATKPPAPAPTPAPAAPEEAPK